MKAEASSVFDKTLHSIESHNAHTLEGRTERKALVLDSGEKVETENLPIFHWRRRKSPERESSITPVPSSRRRAPPPSEAEADTRTP